jgi:hypothetical protein
MRFWVPTGSMEPKTPVSSCQKMQVMLDFHGERGGTRTLDPMIKSHVLYRLSYALTCRAV